MIPLPRPHPRDPMPRPSVAPEKGGTGILPERGGTGIHRRVFARRVSFLLAALLGGGAMAGERFQAAGELSGPALLHQRADGTLEMSLLLPLGQGERVLLVARGKREGDHAWLEVAHQGAAGMRRVGELRLLFAGCGADALLSLDLEALIKAEHGGTGKPGDEDDPDGLCGETPIAKAEHGGTGNPPPPPPGGKRADALELVFSLGSSGPFCGEPLAFTP